MDALPQTFFFFSSPLLCQPVSKLHIHLSDSYNLPVMHLCTPSQCASSRPRCLKCSGKNEPLCTYLNLKVPHCAKLTFTNVPHGSLLLRKRDWTPEITRNKKSPSNVSCLLKFWENVGKENLVKRLNVMSDRALIPHSYSQLIISFNSVGAMHLVKFFSAGCKQRVKAFCFLQGFPVLWCGKEKNKCLKLYICMSKRPLTFNLSL